MPNYSVYVSLQHILDGVMPLALCPLAVSMPPPDDRWRDAPGFVPACSVYASLLHTIDGVASVVLCMPLSSLTLPRSEKRTACTCSHCHLSCFKHHLITVHTRQEETVRSRERSRGNKRRHSFQRQDVEIMVLNKQAFFLVFKMPAFILLTFSVSCF